MEDAAEWSATGLENRGRVIPRGTLREAASRLRFLHLPPPTRSRKVRHRADNAATGGAVPLWWIVKMRSHDQFNRLSFISSPLQMECEASRLFS